MCCLFLISWNVLTCTCLSVACSGIIVCLVFNMLFVFVKSACCLFGKATLFGEVSLSSLLKMMSVEDIRAMLVDLAAVGDDMQQEQVQCVHKTCAIIEDMTMEKAKRFVSSAGDKACFSVFQSDGWSTDIRTKETALLARYQ